MINIKGMNNPTPDFVSFSSLSFLENDLTPYSLTSKQELSAAFKYFRFRLILLQENI